MTSAGGGAGRDGGLNWNLTPISRIADLLTMPEAQDADFEALPPRELARAADLS